MDCIHVPDESKEAIKSSTLYEHSKRNDEDSMHCLSFDNLLFVRTSQE